MLAVKVLAGACQEKGGEKEGVGETSRGDPPRQTVSDPSPRPRDHRREVLLFGTFPPPPLDHPSLLPDLEKLPCCC